MIKETLKELKNAFEDAFYLFKPVFGRFWSIAPWKTFFLAMAIGASLTVFFQGIAYALVVFISFIASIILFCKIYTKARDAQIEEEEKRLKKLSGGNNE